MSVPPDATAEIGATRTTTSAPAAPPKTTDAGGDAYPHGTPFSGPVAVVQPKPRRTRRLRRKKHRKHLQRITVPGLVLIGLTILMVAAFVIPNILPSGGSTAPQAITTDQQANSGSTLNVVDSDGIVPGFSTDATWSAKVPTTASVTGTDRGILVVDGSSLKILNPATGDVRLSETIDQPPTFAVDTVIDGRSALLWQVGSTAEALFDGSSSPKRYHLPADARISSAGSSVLVKSGNALSTFGPGGLVDIPTPEPGTTPMSVEDNTLYSADWNGPVIATDIRTKSNREIGLESPGDGLAIIKWISAGHGKVITLWGEQGSSTNSGHRIQLVVHSLENGTILSTVTTTTDIVGEASWVRGQGSQRAYIGPYLFDMNTGLLLMDTSRNDLHLSEPRGTIVPCTLGNDATCLLAGKNAYRSDTRLVAVTDDGSTATVLGADSTIRAYPRKAGAGEN